VSNESNPDPDSDPASRFGPKALEGSREALRMAAVILETLGGLRTTQEASLVLEIALPRYYLLETRALQGMVTALEPRPKGRRPDPGLELIRLREDVERLEREVLRYQALHRASQRALGLPKEEAAPASGKAKRKAPVRRARKKSRGERVLEGVARKVGKIPAPQRERRAESPSQGASPEVT
jgi:hypothetical protein